MPVQTTQFLMDGTPLSRAQGGVPLQLSFDETLQLVRDNTSGLPVGFFIGIIERESNYTWNQIDTDYDKDGNPRDEKTYGLCMLRKSELIKSLSLGAISDVQACDPSANVAAFSRICFMNKNAILAAVWARGDSTPIDFDLWCYLAWAHNYGIGTVVKSIRNYGLDWNAAKQRPQASHFNSNLVPYAEHIAFRCYDYSSTSPEGTAELEQGTGFNSLGPRIAVLLLGGYWMWQNIGRAI